VSFEANFSKTASKPRALVLSPHPDDAVLSCWSVLTGSADTLVLNLFAGVPPAGTALTSWDRITGAADARARALERVAEDRDALGAAGCGSANLDFPNDELWSTSRDYWTLPAKLLNRVAPHVLAARRRRQRLRLLMPAVLEHVTPEVEIYAPAAVGGHADHRLARDIAWDLLRRGRAVHFYADQPYCTALGWPHWVTGAARDPNLDVDAHWNTFLGESEVDFSRLERRVERLSDADRQQKISALRRYLTQFAGLNAGAGGVLENSDLIGWEVFWHADERD
jgi:LmbE family N-acetylglucosaminyl deacetylase